MAKRKPRKIKSKVYNYHVANRHGHPTSNRWIHGLIVLALIAVVAGIGYVWLHNQHVTLGYTVKKLERQIATIEDDRLKLEVNLSKLKEPSRIRRLVEERQLGLVPPTHNRIVRMNDPEPLVLSEENEPRTELARRLWNVIVLGER